MVFGILLKSQTFLSSRFDELLPEKFRVDGNGDFIKDLVPKYLMKNLLIYDIGGGKRPYLNADIKKSLNAVVIGLDIDIDELKNAPIGIYDEIVCTDIAEYKGKGCADMFLCQALLEHVGNVESAFVSFSSILKPGGLGIIFVPSRNAIFARLNIFLPQKIKKQILYKIFPQKKELGGFKSFYNKCTPREMKTLVFNNDFEIIEERYYFKSSYFSFFFPLYFFWRLWILTFHLFCGNNAAETFSLVIRKK